MAKHLVVYVRAISCPDQARARKLLGFEPKVDLEDGLKRTILWQIERRRKLGTPTPALKLNF